MRIRKISVGPDYKSSMNYLVGQEVVGGNKINEIRFDTKNGHIEIWVINASKETFLWKSFTSTMPVSVEYNIEQFTET